MNWILQTERLSLRRITSDDFSDLCGILQDAEVMYAWEHAFSDNEVYEWIDRNLCRYETDGFGCFAAVETSTGKLIGVIGPITEVIDNKPHIGLSYILAKAYWGKGYAFEGAKACLSYAFSKLKATRVIAEIRPMNEPSRKLAEKLGMQVESEITKYYYNQAMPHLVYACYSAI